MSIDKVNELLFDDLETLSKETMSESNMQNTAQQSINGKNHTEQPISDESPKMNNDYSKERLIQEIHALCEDIKKLNASNAEVRDMIRSQENTLAKIREKVKANDEALNSIADGMGEIGILFDIN